MTLTRTNHLMGRLEVMRFGVMVANTTALAMERIGRFEEAEKFRRKADRRFGCQRRLDNGLSYPRSDRE